jgi:hypothetical protein
MNGGIDPLRVFRLDKLLARTVRRVSNTTFQH